MTNPVDHDLRIRIGVTALLTTYQYLADRDVAVPRTDGAGWRFAHRRVITEGFAPGSRLAGIG